MPILKPQDIQRPPMSTALWRGFRGRCPRCGKGRILRRATGISSWLKIVENCAACGEYLGDIRADDFPAYLTILVVGHVVVPLMLVAEQRDASTAFQLGVFIPMALILMVVLLPRFKGAAAAALWTLNMRSGAPA